MADMTVLIIAVITLAVALITGLTGHLIHLNREKFGNLNSLHMYIGTATTAMVVIWFILILSA